MQENDNDTGWIDKISNVGSEGTDVLVKSDGERFAHNAKRIGVSLHVFTRKECKIENCGKTANDKGAGSVIWRIILQKSLLENYCNSRKEKN